MRKSSVLGGILVLCAGMAQAQSVPSFATPASYAAAGASAMASGDFNGDGKADVVTANGITGGSHGVSILLSNGDGTFQPARNSVTGTDPSAVAVGDFNGDGKLDVAAMNPAGNTLSILLGNGDGTLQAATLAVAGDFNGDGFVDLYCEITGYVSGGGRSNVAPYVYTTSTMSLGHGDGTFSTGATVSDFSVGGENLVVGDFNRDGRLDPAAVFPGPEGRRLAVTPPNSLNIRYGLGDGRFAPAVKFIAGASTTGFTGSPLVTADFDGNSAPDFAWATGAGINAIRNANGNPPLLSKVSLSSAFAVGGLTPVTGTVTIGDPAPAGGAVIALSASDPVAMSFPGGGTVTIPAGATTVAFAVSTAQVAATELVTITGMWNSVPATASFTVVPPVAVSSVTLTPPTVIGLFSGNLGTNFNGSGVYVALNGPAPDGGATVNLSSTSPTLVSVPATLAIPAGTITAFLQANVPGNVPADTPVTLSASYQGVARTGVLTFLTGTDTIRLTKAEYVVKTGQWKVEATDSDLSPAGVMVFSGNGTFIGSLAGTLGAFKGQGVFTGPLTTVILQTFKGGFTTGAVAQK